MLERLVRAHPFAPPDETLLNDCVQQRVVNTRHGPRLRTVNVCAF
jgi:hypothetical protein